MDFYKRPDMNEETKTISNDDGTAEILYRLFIGEKNRPYYLFAFERIKRQQPGNYVPAWHWPAFMFGGGWFLYRKMYRYFALFCALLFVVKIMESNDMPVLAFFFLVIPWISFTIGANHLYYWHAGKMIKSAILEIPDENKRLEYIQYRGGVHRWAIWVIVLSTVVAIAVFQTSKTMSRNARPSYVAPAPPPSNWHK
jgi:hypothetical protein